MKTRSRRIAVLAIIGVVCLVAGLFSPGGAGIRLLSDATRPLHRPGSGVVYASLPEGQKWVNPDGKEADRMHPCAGRDLLYNAHVDAGYVTRNAQGELDVMAVNSTEVIPMDEICVRLPPDSFNGQEVSRFVVPDDPALSFLGAPGTIVWRAPFENYGGLWLPVWAGLGAFDAHHEWQVPNDFVSNSVELSLAGFEGPGEMNIYNYLPGWDRAKRIISSKDLHTTAIDVGGHGHMNWTFSKPGVYRVVWQAQGRHFDGSVERSAPVEQFWLVGEDGQVGLASGTTKGTRGYGVKAEVQRERMGLGEPTQAAPAPTVSDKPTAMSAEQARALVDEQYSSWSRAAVSSGDVSLHTTYDAGDNAVTTVTRRGEEELPNDVIIEVPDSAGRCVAADDPMLGPIAQAAGSRFFWSTGSRGGATPSYSVDTSAMNKDDLSPQQVMIDSSLHGPRNGVYALGLGGQGGFTPEVTNANARTRSLQLQGQKVHELQYMMSAPGVYSENGSVMVYGKDTSNYDWYSPVFLVGNQVINAWREKAGVKERLPETTVDCGSVDAVVSRDPFVDATTNPEPEPSDGAGVEPGDNAGDEDSAGDGAGDPSTQPTKPNPNPEPKPEPKPGAGDEDGTGEDGGTEDPAAQLHRIEAGHIDLALGTVDDQGVAYVRDDSNPVAPVRRDSGTVAIVVPEKAWHRGKETSHVPGFEQGAYVLPEVQDRRLPWPGVSNEAFDFSGVDPDNQSTTFRIANVLSAPEGGRLMMSATEDMALVNQLDTDDLSKALVLPPRTHAHKAFWFTKPGKYEVEYEYSWYDASGEVQRAPLVVTFEVGNYKDSPATGGTTEDPSTGETEKPEPKPQPQPAPKPVPQPAPKPVPQPQPQPQPQPKPGATVNTSAPNNGSRGYVPPDTQSSRGSGSRIVPVSATGPAAGAPARAAQPGRPAAKGTPPKSGATPPPAASSAPPKSLPPSDPRAMTPQPEIEANGASAAKTSEFWRGLMLGIGGLSILGALFLFAHTMGRKSATAGMQQPDEDENLDD